MKGIVALLLLCLCCSLSRGQAGNGNSGGNEGTVCLSDTCNLLKELAALKERLGSMEQEQTVLKYSMGTMGQKLGAVEIKLQASESEVEMMKTVNTAQEKELYSLKERLSVAQPKIAFSVALSDSFNGHTGPFSIDTPLKYLRVFSNSGSGYNPATGIFTAMVRGMYCFRYTMYSNNSGRPNSVLYLMKNN